MNTFIGVVIWGYQAKQEALPLRELAERVGMPASTLSRHLRYLGSFERQGVPGCGWVRLYEWEECRRQKIVKLTRAGQAMAESLQRIFERAV
ncbi:helix-turn-helix domain-containing protein [Ferirhizobium litorale]